MDDDTRNATILIADDNDSSREVLAAILEREGWAVREAADGEAAIAQARAQRPDLVLLDVKMPGRSGLEVCDALRADASWEQVPIIFVSSLADPLDRVEGLRRGAVDYVGKPYDAGEVVARVGAHLRLHRLTRALRESNQVLRAQQARLAEDLQAAVAIQAALLPRVPPAIAGLSVAWRFRPCQQVGGDLFGVRALDGTRLALYVVDVAGHGVPAAMVAVAVSQSLTAGGTTAEWDSPAAVLARLDAEFPIERFERHLTAAVAVIDARTGRLRHSRAGHPLPLLVRRDGRIEPLAAGGAILGLGGAFADGDAALAAGDRLFLYSDGLTELAGPSGEAFGEARLHAALYAATTLPLDAVCAYVLSELEAFAAGAAFADDLTLVAAQYDAVDPDAHA